MDPTDLYYICEKVEQNLPYKNIDLNQFSSMINDISTINLLTILTSLYHQLSIFCPLRNNVLSYLQDHHLGLLLSEGLSKLKTGSLNSNILNHLLLSINSCMTGSKFRTVKPLNRQELNTFHKSGSQ